MFKKPFKVKSNCQMKGSDRKKLLIEIALQFPQLKEELLNSILPSKKAIFQLKVITHSEQLVTIYCLQKLPMLFEVGKVMYPTIYILWSVQDLLHTFTTHPEILQFLVRGADLMLPGVVLPEGEKMGAFGSLKKGDRVAVNLTINKAAVAVGVAANSSYEMYTKQGKCVQILHCYGDHLSTYGTTISMPELGPAVEFQTNLETLTTNRSKDPAFQYLAKITGKLPSSSDGSGKNLMFDSKTNKVESTTAETCELHPTGESNFRQKIESNQADGEEEFDTANFSMNDLLRYCFIKSLRNTMEKVKLPLLTCNFYKLHMVPVCPKGRTLDIKNTTYKKLSNFLRDMSEMGVIQVEDLQKGSQSITKIDYNCEMLKGFVDRFCDKEEVSPRANMSLANKPSTPEITEKYIITSAVLPLFQVYNYKRRESLAASEVHTVIKDYVEGKNLAISSKNSKIILDEVLKRVTNSNKDVKELPWDNLVSKVFGQMENSYKVETSNNSLIKNPEMKGKLQPIEIQVETRTGNKKVTLVNNLELYGINIAQFSKECQHGAAASTTINSLPFAKSLQLQIQGNQVAIVGKLLMEKYNIPIRYLRGLEKALKKKK